jgi:hypothetical protein
MLEGLAAGVAGVKDPDLLALDAVINFVWTAGDRELVDATLFRFARQRWEVGEQADSPRHLCIADEVIERRGAACLFDRLIGDGEQLCS